VRDFDEVRVTSRTFEHAQVLAQETGAVAVESIEQAVRGSDVVCCCTHSSEPVLSRDWLSPGAHVTSVGAALDGPELDPETIRAGLLCVESRVAFQPPPAGSFELQGLDPDEAVELGEVLASTRDGRTSDEQITVYKSMGHAVEDAAAAALVLERASSAGS
jgi:ornithine cyclodeaminase/alanine dehydrogenase-like protein (mu-crystallin family)